MQTNQGYAKRTDATLHLTSGALALALTECADTACGTPRASDRQGARDALAPFVEGEVFDAWGDTRSLTTYEWLDAYGHTIRASEIDLNLEA